MPLDLLVGTITGVPDALRVAARNLEHTGVYVVGVGYQAPLDDDRSWMYFPDGATPFYRVTNFAKYSPANVPGGDTTRYRSYLTETAYSPYKPEPRDGIEDRVEAALRAVGLVDGRPAVASIHMATRAATWTTPRRWASTRHGTSSPASRKSTVQRSSPSTTRRPMSRRGSSTSSLPRIRASTSSTRR